MYSSVQGSRDSDGGWSLAHSDSPALGEPRDHLRRSAAWNSTMLSEQLTYDDADDDSAFLAEPRPFQSAWERNRDGLCGVARELLSGGGEEVPQWVSRALERKEADDASAAERTETPEALRAARIDTERRIRAAEERRLQAFAEERARLEAETRRQEIRRRAQGRVPESTYNPQAPAVGARWDDSNREAMHQRALRRYEAAERERRRQRRLEQAEERAAAEEAERASREYPAEFYWLDKSPRPALSSPLTRPTWRDVRALSRKGGNTRRSGGTQQGRAVVLR